MWSRFFAPWAGITEDPVTGSLHACIGPYWAKRLGDGGKATNGSAAKPAQELRCRCVEPASHAGSGWGSCYRLWSDGDLRA